MTTERKPQLAWLDEDGRDALAETVTRCQQALDLVNTPIDDLWTMVNSLFEERRAAQLESLEPHTSEEKADLERRKWGINSRILDLYSVLQNPTAARYDAEKDLRDAQNRLERAQRASGDDSTGKMPGGVSDVPSR